MPAESPNTGKLYIEIVARLTGAHFRLSVNDFKGVRSYIVRSYYKMGDSMRYNVISDAFSKILT